MATNLILNQAVGSFRYEAPPEEPHRDKPGTLPFITVARESWALGRELAETIVLAMARRRMPPPFQDFKIYDRELCEKLAEESGIHAPLRALLAEEYHNVLEDELLELLADRSPQSTIEHAVFALVLKLATTGRCILVGRGGVCVTRKLPCGVHIRLVAPIEMRIQRMADHFGISHAEARSRIQTQDRDRRRFFEEYFHRDSADPTLYDAIYDTSVLSLDEVAGRVLDLAVTRFKSVAPSLSAGR